MDWGLVEAKGIKRCWALKNSMSDSVDVVCFESKRKKLKGRKGGLRAVINKRI